MHIQVTAKIIPAIGFTTARRQTTDGILIAACVTNPDGTARKGLTQRDFDVHQLAGLLADVQVFKVEEHLNDGYYTILVRPLSPWERGWYVLAVRVIDPTSTLSNGRTLVKFDIDEQCCVSWWVRLWHRFRG